jgi:TRAP-type C4-dicarboxylate transport system permease small subunit
VNHDDNNELEIDQGAGLGTVAAIVGALIIVALIAANTTRIDINFVVYKAHNVPLWWYTIILVGFTIITDRVLRFVMRRRKAQKKKKES